MRYVVLIRLLPNIPSQLIAILSFNDLLEVSQIVIKVLLFWMDVCPTLNRANIHPKIKIKLMGHHLNRFQ